MTRLILTLSLLLCAATAWGGYTNVKVFSGSTWIEDTYINSAAATTNYDGADTLNVYANSMTSTYRKALLRPISTWRDSIPAGATVKRAWWRLWITVKSSTATAYTNRLCPQWVENQATYNIAKTGTNWATAGAGASGTACADCNASGTVDYEGTQASTVLAAASRWEDIPIDTCHINDWLAKRDSVNGTVITAANLQGFTCKSTDGDSVPKLVIEYDTQDMVSFGRNDGNEATDTHLRGGADSTNHYNTSINNTVSCYEPGTTYPALLARWLDALGAKITGRTIDSAFLFLRPTSIESDNDTVLTAMRCSRLWVAAEADYNEYATGSNWGTAGGKNNTSDRVTADSVKMEITAGASSDIRVTVTAHVSAWAADTSLNRGWGIYGGKNNIYNLVAFAGAENTTVGYRPMLRVYMQAQAAPSGPPQYGHGPDGHAVGHSVAGSTSGHKP